MINLPKPIKFTLYPIVQPNNKKYNRLLVGIFGWLGLCTCRKLSHQSIGDDPEFGIIFEFDECVRCGARYNIRLI